MAAEYSTAQLNTKTFLDEWKKKLHILDSDWNELHIRAFAWDFAQAYAKEVRQDIWEEAAKECDRLDQFLVAEALRRKSQQEPR